jgi:REP element-mobilizing transposase RayT
MARRPRYLLPERGVFHVTARAVDGTALYRTRDECVTFLDLLVRAGRLSGWQLYAFCLMTTHYHLVVQARRLALSRALHRANGHYAQLVNARRARRGHLFGDRFAARVIDGEEYLLATVRYVLLNPVRAGLCLRSEDWPWSGSRFGKAVD